MLVILYIGFIGGFCLLAAILKSTTGDFGDGAVWGGMSVLSVICGVIGIRNINHGKTVWGDHE